MESLPGKDGPPQPPEAEPAVKRARSVEAPGSEAGFQRGFVISRKIPYLGCPGEPRWRERVAGSEN